MDIPETGAERAKYAAAAKALEFIKPGMKVGLGTGSTAFYFVALLGEKVAEGFEVLGVPTSTRTREQAHALDIPLATLEDVDGLDIVVDGADEFDPDCNLIKGGGAALLQEKLVAMSAESMIVISDDSKEVPTLGAFPLPVEVVRFGWKGTGKRIEAILEKADVDGRKIDLRMAGDQPLVTDEGHYILDLHLERIGDAPALAEALKQVTGVVETGLFINVARKVIVGEADGSVREF